MYFLLNDVVLNVQPTTLTPPMTARRFAALDLDSARELGQELFSDYPMLHRTHPAQAERLATLILAKASRINAAQFAVPAPGCPPQLVEVSFAELDFRTIETLYERQQSGPPTSIQADGHGWSSAA